MSVDAVNLDVSSTDVYENYGKLLSESEIPHIAKTLTIFNNVMSAFPICAIASSRMAVAKENFKYCFNSHRAVYAVRWASDGTSPGGTTHKANELYRWLCNFHGCPYEYHDYMRNMMPPGCYVVKAE